MTEVEIFKQNLDVSRIVMIITIIMAVTSIVFSALTMAFQRSHNRRSIRPICSIRKLMVNGQLSIIIKNCGLGPMILKNVELVHKNQKERDIDYFLKEIVKEYTLHNKTIDDEIAIAVNEEYELIKIAYKNKIDENTINMILEDFIINITASDLYDRNIQIMKDIAKVQRSAF